MTNITFREGEVVRIRVVVKDSAFTTPFDTYATIVYIERDKFSNLVFYVRPLGTRQSIYVESKNVFRTSHTD